MLGLGQSHYDKPSLMLFNVFANENSQSIWTIPLFYFKDFYCQAQVRSPKVKTKRTWAETIITWATMLG